MSIATESASTAGQLNSLLTSGFDFLDRDESVNFMQYTKYTFSQDGYVFWVANPSVTMTVEASLHYGTDRMQDEDETYGQNEFILSAKDEITEFNLISPTTMWIGTWPVSSGAATLQVMFSRRGPLYQAADVWHYSGTALIPSFSNLIVASESDLPAGPIVSNSLPIWLSQNSLAPVYPSFLVPDNAVPPYIVAHVEEDKTISIGGSMPVYGWPGTPNPKTALQQTPSVQQMRDFVRLTLYGFNNQQVWQYISSLYEYSLNPSNLFGFANTLIPKDMKKPQKEIAAIAMCKTIDAQCNYFSAAADVLARRLILSSIISATV